MYNFMYSLMYSFDMFFDVFFDVFLDLFFDVFFAAVFAVSAREACWRRAFDPCAPLLFVLYRYLEQNLHFGSVPEPPQVLSARSFQVAGFDTLNIPRSFSCGL